MIETGSYNFCKLSLAEAQSSPSPSIGAHSSGSPSQSSEAGPSQEEQRSNANRGVAGTSGEGLDHELQAGLMQKVENFGRIPSAIGECQLREDDDARGGNEEERNGDDPSVPRGEASRGIPPTRGGLSAVHGSTSSGLAAGLRSDGQGSTAAGARSMDEGANARALGIDRSSFFELCTMLGPFSQNRVRPECTDPSPMLEETGVPSLRAYQMPRERL